MNAWWSCSQEPDSPLSPPTRASGARDLEWPSKGARPNVVRDVESHLCMTEKKQPVTPPFAPSSLSPHEAPSRGLAATEARPSARSNTARREPANWPAKLGGGSSGIPLLKGVFLPTHSIRHHATASTQSSPAGGASSKTHRRREHRVSGCWRMAEGMAEWSPVGAFYVMNEPGKRTGKEALILTPTRNFPARSL